MIDATDHLHITAAAAMSLELCGHGAVVGVNQTDNTALVVPLTCKSWACSRCRPTKIAQWSLTARAGRPDRLITLTWRPDPSLSTRQTFQLFTAAFTKLWKRITHHFGNSPYMKVYELHRSGYPHLHILQRGPYIPQAWLSHNWVDCGGGPVVDIRRILSPELAATHIMKYLGKRIARTVQLCPRLRLITKSKDFVPEGHLITTATRRPGYVWTHNPRPFWIILSAFAQGGATHTNHANERHIIELNLARFTLATQEVSNVLTHPKLWDIHRSNSLERPANSFAPVIAEAYLSRELTPHRATATPPVAWHGERAHCECGICANKGSFLPR